MTNFEILATQTPGVVRFDNYEELKTGLEAYVKDTFDVVNYEEQGITVAKADRDELKERKDVITKAKKELKEAYSAPYTEVEKKLDELAKIIEAPYKRAKEFVDEAEKIEKTNVVMQYARQRATELGEAGEKVIGSPAFFNPKWLNKTCKVKNYQDEIDQIIANATQDLLSIQSSGGDHVSILTARYYETLSMDGVKSFIETIESEMPMIDENAVVSENNVVGYKVLKITATEDQMASIMNQLDLMGVDFDEIEDGMPKSMEELTIPNFDSFVAFDIETTGSNGAANGDSEAKITEIGAVRVINGKVVERFDQLANPGRPITPMISRITHITNEMVADMPPVDDVIKMFYDFVGDSILVGHNIKSSDLRYITKAAHKAGIHFEVPFLDTYLLAKKHKDSQGWDKVNLGYLAQHYGFEHKEAHRAWSDAEVNAAVYFELKKLT